MRDDSFWTWPIDIAAAQTRSRGLAVSACLFYATGALLMLTQMLLGLPGKWSGFGLTLILLAIVCSVCICGKVMMARARGFSH